MDNTYKPSCSRCGTAEPLFNMWIIVTLKKHGNIVNERLCPCCGSQYDSDPCLLQKTPENPSDRGSSVNEPLFFINY